MRLLLETLGLLRSLFFTLPLFYLCTAVLGVVSLLLSPINPSARRQHEYSRLWGRLLLIICGVRVRMRGLEKLDPARHYVYLANHRSYLDIPILFARLPGEFRTMAKASLFHLPFLGWHIRRAGHLPIAGSNVHTNARRLLQTIKCLRANISLLVFPEAERSVNDELGEFKPGIFLAALKARAPIVPITIRGSGHVLPRYSWHLRPGTVEIIVDEPIPTEGLSRADIETLITRVHDCMKNNLTPAPQPG